MKNDAEKTVLEFEKELQEEYEKHKINDFKKHEYERYSDRYIEDDVDLINRVKNFVNVELLPDELKTVFMKNQSLKIVEDQEECKTEENDVFLDDENNIEIDVENVDEIEEESESKSFDVEKESVSEESDEKDDEYYL